MLSARRLREGVACLCFILFLGWTSTIQAQSQVIENTTATVSINSIFTMSVSQPSLNFGNVDPGPTTTPTREFYLYCESNNNNLWQLSINLIAPLTSEGSTIPNQGFNWWGWTNNGSGTWDGGSGDLDTLPHTFYSAGGDEWLTSAPIQHTMQFNVDIPEGQAVGIYTATLIVKMRDTVTSQEVEEIIYVTLGVNPSFALAINPSSLDFPTTLPGITTGEKTLHLSCSTNNNTPWSLNMKVISELTSGAYTIPNEAFKWSGSSNGNGTFYAGPGYVSTEAFTFYDASLDEYVTSAPLELFLNFYVEVPQNQVAGSYTTTLVFTMTE